MDSPSMYHNVMQTVAYYGNYLMQILLYAEFIPLTCAFFWALVRCLRVRSSNKPLTVLMILIYTSCRACWILQVLVMSYPFLGFSYSIIKQITLYYGLLATALNLGPFIWMVLHLFKPNLCTRNKPETYCIPPGSTPEILCMRDLWHVQRPWLSPVEICQLKPTDTWLPMIHVIVPSFNENPENLQTLIISVFCHLWEHRSKQVIISFDGMSEDREKDGMHQLLRAMKWDYDEYPVAPHQRRVTYGMGDWGFLVHLIRGNHGGKRATQKAGVDFVTAMWRAMPHYEMPDNRYKDRQQFLYFLDSDCKLQEGTLTSMMYHMEFKHMNQYQPSLMTAPYSAKPLAMTCQIGCDYKIYPQEEPPLWAGWAAGMQDLEFFQSMSELGFVAICPFLWLTCTGQHYERFMESTLGGLTCVPGAALLVRMSHYKEMEAKYLSDANVHSAVSDVKERRLDWFDYWRKTLGEDRFFTHIMMHDTWSYGQIQFCSDAVVQTAPQDQFKNIFKQRRRWLFGYLANEVAMLTNPDFWRRFPALMLFRLVQAAFRSSIYVPMMLLTTIWQPTGARDDDSAFLAVTCVSTVLPFVLQFLHATYVALKTDQKEKRDWWLVVPYTTAFNSIALMLAFFWPGRRGWGTRPTKPKKE